MVQNWIDTDAIGAVSEVKIWTNRPVWPQGVQMPAPDPSLKPDALNWDLWLGPAASTKYTSQLHPFNWRGWWDYGTGALGDMGCHIIETPFNALDLGFPLSAESSNTEFWIDDFKRAENLITFPASRTAIPTVFIKSPLPYKIAIIPTNPLFNEETTLTGDLPFSFS